MASNWGILCEALLCTCYKIIYYVPHFRHVIVIWSSCDDQSFAQQMWNSLHVILDNHRTFDLDLQYLILSETTLQTMTKHWYLTRYITNWTRWTHSILLPLNCARQFSNSTTLLKVIKLLKCVWNIFKQK